MQLKARKRKSEKARRGRDAPSKAPSPDSGLKAHWLTLHRTNRGTEFIGIVPTRVLNPPGATGMTFWSLNPYVGCEFGCSYCYARETHQWTVERAANRRDAPAAAREATLLPIATGFERRILVKVSAPEILARTLDPAKLGETPVVIGSATDPYQPAERRYEVTRRVLEVFLKYEGLHIGIITKSALITRDVELLATLARRHDVGVHFSIGSLDGALLRQLEPRSAAPAARLRVLRKLTDAGVRCDVLLMPILPGLTDGESELRDVVFAAKAAGATAVAGGAVRMGPATRNTLLPWLDQHRPALAERYRSHFGERQYVSKRYGRALNARLERLQREAGFASRATMSGSGDFQPMQGELF